MKKNYLLIAVCIPLIASLLCACADSDSVEKFAPIPSEKIEAMFLEAGFVPVNVNKDSIGQTYLEITSEKQAYAVLQQLDDAMNLYGYLSTSAGYTTVNMTKTRLKGGEYQYAFQCYKMDVTFRGGEFLSGRINPEYIEVNGYGITPPGLTGRDYSVSYEYRNGYNCIIIHANFEFGLNVGGNKLVGYSFIMGYECYIIDTDRVAVRVIEKRF